ncbi:MAG: hypothetical protein ACXWV6_13095 [Chitinophagaceae bacterium]
MKYLKPYGFSLSFIFCCAISFAQDRVVLKEPDHNKPTLFSSFPDKIPVEINELKNLFSNTAAKGKEVNTSFRDKKLPGFKGKIISATSKYNNSLQSVVVRSTQFNGATLTFSSFTTTDGTVRYSGRIVSFQHDDVFVLQKQNDQYFFVKKKFNELVNE